MSGMTSPSITQELSAHVRRRLAEYLAEPDPHNLRSVVEKFGALPLVGDMGGMFALRPDGEVISYGWDEPHDVAVLRDARLRNAVLFRGSMKYPELGALVPARPTDAIPCPHCEEVAAIQREIKNIVCFCGGLGWLPPTLVSKP